MLHVIRRLRPAHRHHRRRLVPAFGLVVLIGAPIASHGQITGCARPIDPMPLDVPMGRPTEAFPTRDHLFVHASTHLQGAPDETKIAAGLIHRPSAPDDLADMTSALSVTNTSNTLPTTVTVQFFDHLGVDMGAGMPPPACVTPPFVLAPEETRILAAVPLDPATGCGGEGVGSARVTVDAGDPPIVGSVIHHAYCFFNDTVCDTDAIPPATAPPGATAMEQLQRIQETTELWAGPFPLTAAATEDVLNGMAPIVSVTNPTAAAAVGSIDLVISDPVAMTTLTVPFRPLIFIPANGTWIESTGIPLNELDAFINPQPPFPVGLWQQALFALLATPGIDLDISVRITSLGGDPLLGNVLFTDFFADTPATNLALGERFRVASTVLQGAPTGFLENPELSFEPGPDPLLETYVLLQNVGTDPTLVEIEYFDNLGNLMSVGNIPALAPNQAVRIVPGTFGYPAGPTAPGGPTGFGWMRIRACNPGNRLIGWSVREILDPATHPVYNIPTAHEDHFMKAYGEILMSTAAAEPGMGYPVTIGNDARTRKLSPLIRVDGTAWPGYSTAVNDTVANLFDYEWRIFNLAGFACGTAPFPGLPFRAATWTYEDPITLPACVAFGTGIEGTAAIDVSTGTVIGIDVIGDPMREWAIPGFADGEPPTGGGGGGGGDIIEP